MASLTRHDLLARFTQVVDYVFSALYASIVFQFVLEMFAARDGNGFKRFLDAATHPFLAPFRTLLPSVRVGGSEVIFSYLAALAAYGLLHLGLRKLAMILAEPATIE